MKKQPLEDIEKSTKRVYKGGSGAYKHYYFSIAFRDYLRMNRKRPLVGFRIVRSKK